MDNLEFPNSKYDFEFKRRYSDEEGGYLIPNSLHHDFMVFLFASKFKNKSLNFKVHKNALQTIYYFLEGES